MTNTSRLFYHNAPNVEAQLGDRVLVKRWFRKPLSGVVTYLPGISPFHPNMEPSPGDDSGIREWGISFEDGSLLKGIYFPERVPLSKSILFIERGDAVSLDPSDLRE